MKLNKHCFFCEYKGLTRELCPFFVSEIITEPQREEIKKIQQKITKILEGK